MEEVDGGVKTGHRIRVVIGDDHPMVREGTKEMLGVDPGIVVVGEAEDGEQLIACVEREQPDVVVIDIRMPVVNGIEATRRIKAALPSTAVLILSAYDDDSYVFALIRAGATGYLLKDVSSRTLVEAVHQVHSGEPVLHPTIAKKVLARVATAEDASPVPMPARLTEREQHVLRLAATGLNNAEIADVLSVSVRTVQTHLTQIFGKLDVGSRTGAVIAGLKMGLLRLDDLDG